MRLFLLTLLAATVPFLVNGQRADMMYYRLPNQLGIGQFEAPKETDNTFDEVKVRIGGGLAIQFQGLSQENGIDTLPLVDLTSNFNLPTANLDLDVQFAPGVRMHLRTYLSSRHHPEAWVKGGYLQVDKLDFIEEDFAAGLMDHLRIKIGHMEINYGDTHFRRSDNGFALYNPFVGNYLFDSFTTEIAGELYYFFDGGLFAMAALSNGRLNQDVTSTATQPAFYAKLGYDKEFTDDFRFRLTGSLYTKSNDPDGTGRSSVYLYTGDRAGARYYSVLDVVGGGESFRSGRVNPGMSDEITSIMINPFIKAGGLEIFGVAEFVSGGNFGEGGTVEDPRNYGHYGAELLYRFGSDENFYIGGRYNSVSGELDDPNQTEISVNRINIGGGWFMTKNIVAKLEYVSQNHNDYPAPNPLHEAQFNGVMLEAAIGF